MEDVKAGVKELFEAIEQARPGPGRTPGAYSWPTRLSRDQPVPDPSTHAARAQARTDSGVRLAELLAAISMATDLGMGQPLESALCSCVVAMRLAQALDVDHETLHDVYLQALLRYIGCNADTDAMSALFGDELALRHDFARLDPGRPAEVLGVAMRYMREAAAGEPPLRMATFVARGLVSLPRLMSESFAGHCEVAQRLAERLGLSASLIACLGQIYERWDGKGLPRKLKGEQVAQAVQIVTLAQDAVVWTRIGGAEAAVATVGKRGGGAYDPRMATRFCEQATTILAGLAEEPTWQAVLELEPGEHGCLSEVELDRACEALADFADIKSPFTLGHSSAVASLAAGAGRRAGLVQEDVTALRRAGLLHDIGRAGVSASIWGKETPLTEREWEQVRLHTYYTARVLARAEPLRGVAALASQHHERLDGSGYHRNLNAHTLTAAARILAAADAYQAMTEARPHRAPLSPDQAAEESRREVRAGRLDSQAVNAVLAEAGHHVSRVRMNRPRGISEREVEVLRLLVRGHSNHEMARRLVLSPDTVKHHIQHIYNKIGVSTRAGATLFAMENDLL
ncbi:MAG: HD domain-containing protein [Chloroflexi bacterium]|nr:HD domain-containing protein [Chloroflexota bacterium]